MDLLLRLAAPESWDRPGASLALRFGWIAATNTAPVLDEVARIVGDLRSEFLRSVVVDAEVVEGPADLAGRLAGPEDEGFLLSEAERTALDAAIAAGEARVETRLRSVSLAGGRKAVSALRERAYLEDFEVEIAQKATIANPILQRLQEGTVLDVEPVVTCAGDAVHACVRFTRAAAEDPIRQVPTPFGDLDAPVLHLVRLRADVHLPLGRTGVVGAGADGDRGFLLLLTCRVAE
jgi:hypothetical protein